MAAEALEKEAIKRGYEVKVETQGSDGINNKLDSGDINSADIIIHCLAVTPEGLDRFEGKEVYEVSLQDMIKNPEGTLTEIEEDMGF